jgi:cysteinyl-tRNA synthetase
MSKSLGNFISISSILKDYDQEVLRLFFISSHYASPQDFTHEKLDEQKKALERFYILFNKIDSFKKEASLEEIKDVPSNIKEKICKLENAFIDAMDDDFNTAMAGGFLFDMVVLSNKILDDTAIANEYKYSILEFAKDTILKLGKVFGLFINAREGSIDAEITGNLVEFLIELRERARNDKDFKTADLIRDRLLKLGFILEDAKEGTTARRTV